MKFSVNTMVWTTRVGEPQAALLARIREWGFEGVELFLSPEEPADLAAVRRRLDALGLARTACCVLPRAANLVDADPAVRARGREFLKTCIERSAEMGATLICGPIYAGLGVMTGRRRNAAEWHWAVEGLASAAEAAQSAGVQLCLEPLNRFETYFLNTLADAARLVQAVGSPQARIHFDTFHANIEERDPAAALRSAAPWLGHVHASENDRGTPGSGHVAWRSILGVLHEIGYGGWVCIESFAQPEPELAAAAAIWRDLADSGDELACNGLHFLQNLAREIEATPQNRPAAVAMGATAIPAAPRPRS